MGGTPNFVFRDGSRLTPYMFYQIERLSADLNSIFGVRIIVSSGIRVPQEQIDIFLERYVTAGNVRGRRVYDTRVWNGVRYYRISSAGTVAVPGTSNHEIQGSKAAVDIRDTGGDAGITVASSRRGRWIRENAWRYGLIASGDGFGEGWHFDILNIWSAVPGGSSTPTRKGPMVTHYHREDATSRARGRELAPGNSFWLNTTDKAAVSQATNVAGGIGPTIFTLHVYATGTPGDAVDVQLYWDQTTTDGPHSGHYTERMVFDKEGVIQRSVTSQRGLGAGDAVYANFRAAKTNKSNLKVQLFDSDAYLVV